MRRLRRLSVLVLRTPSLQALAGRRTPSAPARERLLTVSSNSGGFMVIRPATSSQLNLNPLCTEPISIDFRETAPAASSAHMYAAHPSDPSFDATRASKIGGLAVGVPGELRGLEKAYELCGGGVPWARLVQPSIDIARESAIGPEMARRLANPRLSSWMLEEKDYEWQSQFAPGGEFLKEGGLLRRENYARTLETIAEEGAGAFYEVRLFTHVPLFCVLGG